MNAVHNLVDNRRYHRTAKGNLPGVTTILSATANNPGLDYWKANTCPDEQKAIMDAAIKRGDWLDKDVETWAKTGVKPSDNPYFTQIEPWIDNISKVISVQDSLVSDLGFAGTPDLVCIFDGMLTVIDIKTSRKRKTKSKCKDYFLQVCAYILAYNEETGENCNSGALLIASDDNKPNRIDIDSNEVPFYTSQFLARLEMYQEKFNDGF